MHASMPPSTEVVYVHSLRRAAEFFQEQGCSAWNLFAGTSLSSKLHEVVSEFFLEKYNIHFDFVPAVFAEKNKDKQEFLRQQHPNVQQLCGDVMELSAAAIDNIKHKDDTRRSLLPRCDLLDAGVPCQSRTSASNNAAANINCVQKGTELTGLGWKGTLSCVRANQPHIGCCECVPGLAQVDTSDSPISDAHFMVQELNSLGMWAKFSDVDTLDYAHLQDRKRLWWQFARMKRCFWSEASRWNHDLMTVFKLQPFQFSGDDFLTHDHADRKAEAMEVGLPVLADFGRRIPCNRAPLNIGKADAGWKFDHFNICRANSVQWPVNLQTVGTPSLIVVDGLRDREIEAACMADLFWPPRNSGIGSAVETVDINPDTKRIFKSHLHEDSCVKTPEEHQQTSAWGPWRQGLCTQIGSGKVLVRYKLPSPVPRPHGGEPYFHGIRLIEPLEAMRLIGWSDDCWVDSSRPKTLDDLDLYHNLAGNAFCFAHYIPVFCSLLSTFGRFSVDDGQGMDRALNASQPGPAASSSMGAS